MKAFPSSSLLLFVPSLAANNNNNNNHQHPSETPPLPLCTGRIISGETGRSVTTPSSLFFQPHRGGSERTLSPRNKSLPPPQQQQLVARPLYSTHIPSSSTFNNDAPPNNKNAIDQTKNPNDAQSTTATKKLRVALVGVTIIATLVSLRGLYMPVLSSLLDKKRMQAWVLQLRGTETAAMTVLSSWKQCARGYSLYAAGLASCEFLGLSTILLELAAGMVFGWSGMVVGIVAKLVGDSLGFFVGRRHLRHFVLTKFSNHASCSVLLKSTTTTTTSGDDHDETDAAGRHPAWLSALLMKFSILPGMSKTLGTAVLLPNVTYGWFFMANALYNVLFSVTLTCLGVRAASHGLELGGANGSVGMAAAVQAGGGHLVSKLAMATLICIWGIAPMTTAWWIQDLRKGMQQQQQPQPNQQPNQPQQPNATTAAE